MVKARKGANKAGKKESLTAAAEGNEESNARDSEMYDRLDFLELEEDDRLEESVNRTRKAGGAGPDRVEEIFPLSDDDDLDLPHFVKKHRKSGNLDDILDDDEIKDEGDIHGFGWGKKRRHFYGGNPNDDRKNGDENGDLDEAEAEAKESKAIQTKQLQDLDEEDFLDAFVQTETEQGEEKKKQDLELLDLTEMSRKEKLDLFHRESPEFKGVVAEFFLRTEEGKKVQFIVDNVKSGHLPADSSAAKYAVTKHRIIMNYLTTISAYLMFKTRRTNLKFHPITATLVKYKRILDRMPEKAEVAVERALQLLNEGKSLKSLTKRKGEKKMKKKKEKEKKLKLLNEEENERDEGLTYDERKAVEMYKATRPKATESLSEEEEEEVKEEEMNEGGEEEDEKRAITYQMAKNKGLKPKRSKVQRNPRVKHRVKFEKAKKRRKGQVREVRKEVKKYMGEHSGINVRVKKGIKLM